ncbi:hypothetical protein FB446DRAFT_713835 [Lentinula raphanica]|nr:hypothetical protein FB446DRAFT_713835 [Lentinula raphanica]
MFAPVLTTRQQIFTAVQSNTKHQYALEKYCQRLTAELQEIDKLLAAADVGDLEDDQPRDIEIQGASRPVGPIPEQELLNPVSPFYNEAIKRSRYFNATITHAMKPKELETLTEAVTAEFRRLKAFEGQGRNIDAIDLAADASNLNWRTIAEKVSDVSTFARSDHECRTKWLGYYRPGICHDEWSPDELRRLNEIVSEKNEEHALDWVDVAQELGTNRTPMDCMRHGFKLPQHAWDSDADKRLSEAVEVYGTENWPLVALHVSPNVTSNQCLMRYHRSLDPSLNKSPWSDDEDERLNVIVSVLGTTNWPDVARHMPGRTNEMCRERYVEGMRNKGKLKAKGKAKAKVDDGNDDYAEDVDEEETADATKSEWTKDKDEELVRLVGDLGNKWQKISTILGGVHTHNQCRTRYKRLTGSAPGAQSTSATGATSGDHSVEKAPLSYISSTANAHSSTAPHKTSQTLTFLPGDSDLPILQLMPSSITNPGPTNASATEGAPASGPSQPAQVTVKSRPKPKLRTTRASKASNTDAQTHNPDEAQMFSSNSASIGVSSGSAAPTKAKQKRSARRRTAIISAAIEEDLASLEHGMSTKNVPSSSGPIRGWGEGEQDQSSANQAPERNVVGQIGGWEPDGHVGGTEGEVPARKGGEARGQVMGWEDNTDVRSIMVSSLNDIILTNICRMLRMRLLLLRSIQLQNVDPHAQGAQGRELRLAEASSVRLLQRRALH